MGSTLRKPIPSAIGQRASSLSKAAASFGQLMRQDAVGAKAEQLHTASRTVASLFNDQMAGLDFGDLDANAPDALRTALTEIKQAFEALAASYDPPSRQQWLAYAAWSNLLAVYDTLDL
jgi:hypothetical protein